MKVHSYEKLNEDNQNTEENLFGFGVNDSGFNSGTNNNIGTFSQQPNPGGGSCVSGFKTICFCSCSSCTGAGSSQAKKVSNLREKLYIRN